MNITLTSADLPRIKEKPSWLDVRTLSRIEATSEDSRYPIKSAFEMDGHGWRAVEVGEQTIRLIFDNPQRIKRIQLCFMESDVERTQQFTLLWSPDQTGEMRPLIEQEWNFSPPGSTVELETYETDLAGVQILQLVISPGSGSGNDVATMASCRIG
jgi:hypothetical protein